MALQDTFVAIFGNLKLPFVAIFGNLKLPFESIVSLILVDQNHRKHIQV